MLLAVGLVVLPKLGKVLATYGCRRRLACCRPEGDSADSARLLDGFSTSSVARDDSALTMQEFLGNGRLSDEATWATAVRLSRLSKFDAVAQGIGKVFGWHLAQPVGYFAIYGCMVIGGELDNVQVWLGGMVAAREALYLLLVVACVCAKPAFLLVSLGATINDKDDYFGGVAFDQRYGFLATYCFAPGVSALFSLATDASSATLLEATR